MLFCYYTPVSGRAEGAENVSVLLLVLEVDAGTLITLVLSEGQVSKRSVAVLAPTDLGIGMGA